MFHRYESFLWGLHRVLWVLNMESDDAHEVYGGYDWDYVDFNPERNDKYVVIEISKKTCIIQLNKI